MKTLSSPDTIVARRAARWASIAALPFLFGTASCTYVPDAVNPVEWYRSASSVFEGEEAQQSRAKAKAAAERTPPIPNADQPYPNLGEVPDRPEPTPAAERNRAAQGLAADRENARYIETQPQRAAPPGAPGLAPVAAPRTSVSPAAPLPAPAAEPPPPAAPQPHMDPGRDTTAPFQQLQPPGPQSSVGPLPSEPADMPPLPAASGPRETLASQPRTRTQEESLPPFAETQPAARPIPVTQAAQQPVQAAQSVSPQSAAPARVADPRPVPPASARSDGTSLVEETFRKALAQSLPTTTIAPVGPTEPAPIATMEQPVARTAGAAAPVAAPASVAQPVATAGTTLPPPARLGSGPTSQMTVYFAHGSAAVGRDDRQLLREAAALHKVHGGRVRIDGYASNRTASCDPARKEIANFRISSQRAEAVARELARLGVPRREMVVRALSDQGTSSCDVTPAEEAASRRVEVFLEY